MKKHTRALLLAAAATLAGTALVSGCDTLFIMGDDPYWSLQVCKDGTTNCFPQGTTTSTPAECIPSATNNDIDDGCGAFVSPDGSDADGTAGTKDAPFLTLAHAISAATTGRVYACANASKPFDEAVSPTVNVTMYGGLDCANGWFYDGTKKSGWTAPADTVPLAVTATAKVEIYDFAITARDAEAAGGSSIAVLAAGTTPDLHLEKCNLVAGNGKDGVNPDKPAGSGAPGGSAKDGADGCIDMTSKIGGDPGTNTCDAISRDGGVGGNGTTSNGGQGTDGQPQPGTPPNDGVGGKAQDAQSCNTGNQGGDGKPGEPGLGASGVGAISSNGYIGAAGDPGKSSGDPGQGGGGGGGAKKCQTMGYAGPGGGGGGAGGCGGLPGTGAGPGGASIGLLSAGATVSLVDVRVTAATGGNGGTGGDGQSGGLGGSAGNAGKNAGDFDAKACNGGGGGKGGDGGPGGGGQGGPSVGIAFTGTAPTQTKVTISPGTPGEGGPGGNMTMESSAKGAPGLACKTLDFEQGAVGCEP
jgi:hypothetical protein